MFQSSTRNSLFRKPHKCSQLFLWLFLLLLLYWYTILEGFLQFCYSGSKSVNSYPYESLTPPTFPFFSNSLPLTLFQASAPLLRLSEKKIKFEIAGKRISRHFSLKKNVLLCPSGSLTHNKKVCLTNFWKYLFFEEHFKYIVKTVQFFNYNSSTVKIQVQFYEFKYRWPLWYIYIICISVDILKIYVYEHHF